MSKTRTDYGSGVARPKIKEKDSFELKGQFLKEFRENTFSGSDNKDANEHIEKQKPDETLYQAWEHFKELLMKCLQHYLTERGRNTETSEGLAAIQIQLNNIGREIKKNSIMKEEIVYKGDNVVGALMNVPIFVGTFSVVTDFAVFEDMDAYRDEGMRDVILGEPFLKEVEIKARRFKGMITIYLQC
uniref:Uncharacterized protein n=1 Tax=Tanacetum cinerariifolium TaxID=118510 RepID=A0A6L2KFW2_TANCI|nr:hypothetical protein [Tanacetum cinerariifolium]